VFDIVLHCRRLLVRLSMKAVYGTHKAIRSRGKCSAVNRAAVRRHVFSHLGRQMRTGRGDSGPDYHGGGCWKDGGTPKAASRCECNAALRAMHPRAPAGKDTLCGVSFGNSAGPHSETQTLDVKGGASGYCVCSNLIRQSAATHYDRQVQVQVRVCFTSVDGQVQPLDAALGHSVLSKSMR
jgi:hypothetical protein